MSRRDNNIVPETRLAECKLCPGAQSDQIGLQCCCRSVDPEPYSYCRTLIYGQIRRECHEVEKGGYETCRVRRKIRRKERKNE